MMPPSIKLIIRQRIESQLERQVLLVLAQYSLQWLLQQAALFLVLHSCLSPYKFGFEKGEFFSS